MRGSMTTTQRIRGPKLQKLRKRLMMENPLCVVCFKQGKVQAATELDHIVPVSQGGSNEDSNLQFLCSECHRVKTAMDLGHTYHPPIGLDGWPVIEAGGEGRQKSRHPTQLETERPSFIFRKP